jgi:acyl-CoA reductase-like NAD-dependent aldehyde dehydrogenase
MQSSVEGAAAMRRLSGYARSTLLQKAAQALQSRQEEFARTMMAEAGKPLTDARREVGRAVQTFSIAGEEAKRIGGEVVPLDWSPGMESYWGGDAAISHRTNSRDYPVQLPAESRRP